VGIIGTEAIAVRRIPYLRRAAKELFVFQRTASSVDVRANRLTDLNWVQDLAEGWHRARMENFDTLTAGQGVEAITENGIVANGQKHEVDCIIIAMGFEVGAEYTRPAGYDVIAKEGIKLSDK
jgi:hypothetical protein